jgi:hypothetical protein
MDILKWFRKPQPATPQFDLNKAKADAYERHLAESIAYSPPFDLINPFQSLYDGQNLLFPIFPGRYDSRVSSNYLFLTETQLDLLRVYSRFLYELNPTAKAPLQRLCDYTIGKGFTYSVAGKDSNDALIEQAQDIIDKFIEVNNWSNYEQEIFLRTHRDGETFLTFFPQEDGLTIVKVVEPETIRNPYTAQNLQKGPNQAIDGSEVEWKFGIKTKSPDNSTPLAYAVMYYTDPISSFEVIEAKDMVHVKANVDRQIKRGLSDFFALQEVLINLQKLLRAGVLGESVRQSIAMIRQFSQANQATVQSLQSNNTSFYEPQPIGPNNSPNLQPVQIVQPGSQVDIPEGLEYQSGPQGNSSNAVELLNASYQQLAAWWGVPQWLVSGSSDDTNFASSLVSESPFIKNVERRQQFYEVHFKKVMKRVLEIAEEQGLLPVGSTDKLKIEVECQSAHVRDAGKETEQNETLYTNQIMSKKTWQLREELDPEQEEENMKNEEPPPIGPMGIPMRPMKNESMSAKYNEQTGRDEVKQ